MCDSCKTPGEVLKMLRLDNEFMQDSLPDAVTRAATRLRCYYECVTRDADIFDEDEDEDFEWLPEY